MSDEAVYGTLSQALHGARPVAIERNDLRLVTTIDRLLALLGDVSFDAPEMLKLEEAQPDWETLAEEFDSIMAMIPIPDTDLHAPALIRVTQEEGVVGLSIIPVSEGDAHRGAYAFTRADLWLAHLERE